MLVLSTLSQIAVSLSILIIWIFRFNNVERDFRDFKLNDIVRNIVGVAKTSLSIILLIGIWYQEMIVVTYSLLAIFMIFAQYYHYTIRNSWRKHLPSLILLTLCIFIILSKF
jgi:hypothetical protein